MTPAGGFARTERTRMVLALGLNQYVVAGLVVLFLLVSVILILTILIQRPQGGGLSGAFGSGGGAGQTAFGTRTGDALTTATIAMFVIYLGVAVGLNFALRPTEAPADTEPELVDPEAPATETGETGSSETDSGATDAGATDEAAEGEAGGASTGEGDAAPATEPDSTEPSFTDPNETPDGSATDATDPADAAPEGESDGR